MSRRVEIRGGAGQFEAAVIAVVLDRLAQEELAARQGRGKRQPGLSAWVRVIQNREELRPGLWAPRQDFPHLG
jgi:hypothetical protein